MPSEIISLPPVAFAVWLVLDAVGPSNQLVRERAGIALGAAILLGPMALSLLGLFPWLLLLALGTVGLTGYATLRRRGGALALPSPARVKALVERRAGLRTMLGR